MSSSFFSLCISLSQLVGDLPILLDTTIADREKKKLVRQEKTLFEFIRKIRNLSKAEESDVVDI